MEWEKLEKQINRAVQFGPREDLKEFLEIYRDIIPRLYLGHGIHNCRQDDIAERILLLESYGYVLEKDFLRESSNSLLRGLYEERNDLRTPGDGRRLKYSTLFVEFSKDRTKCSLKWEHVYYGSKDKHIEYYKK